MRCALALFVTLTCLGVCGYALPQEAPPWERWHPPAYNPPQPNGYDELIAAAALLEPVGALDPNAPLEAQQRLVRALQPAFDGLTSALQRDGLAPEILTFDQELKYLSGLRNLARACLLRATVQAAAGDRAAAAQSDLDAYALGAAVPRGGVIIHRLVGIACQAMASRDLSRRVVTFARQDAAPALERLQNLSARPYPYSLTIENERALGLCSLKAHAPAAGDPLAVALYQANQWEPLVQSYARALAQAQRPWPQRGALEPPGGVFDEALLPMFERTFTKIAQSEAETHLLTAKLALWLYFCDHGAFPAALADLVPTYLPAVPQDPFCGRPLRYERRPQGFRLWSVGDDGLDQEGTPKAKPDLGETGDLVDELTL